MPISRPDRVHMALREPGGLLRAGDSGHTPCSRIIVSPHRPRTVQAVDPAYHFVTYTVEPWRRRSRHQCCAEHEAPVTDCGGPGPGAPATDARLTGQDA
jgi:hypothetical protein